MKIIFKKHWNKVLIFPICLIIFYLLLLNFPQLLFRSKLSYKSFIVYSHSKPDANIYKVLDQADQLISNSEFTKNNKTHHKIFFCSSFSEFTFFAFLSSRAFAINQFFTNNILIAKPDVILNTAKRNDKKNNTRTLSGVIAHEVTHSLIKNEIGSLKYFYLETWKNEGYCDFIANESSFNFKNGMDLIGKNRRNASPSFRYFKYRLYVSYLIRNKKFSFAKLAKTDFNLRKIDEAVYAKYSPKTHQ